MKKRKQAEQEPLCVRWRGDLRELVPFVSKHASGFSIVERFGDHIKSFRMVPNDGASRNIIEEWLEEYGTIIPLEANLQRNFRKQPTLKADRVDEAPAPPDGIIEGLNEDWEYFQKTRKCPKCDARTMGIQDVYDDTCSKMRLYACPCGKQLYPGGSAHLGKVQHQMKHPTKGHTHRRKLPVSVHI